MENRIDRIQKAFNELSFLLLNGNQEIPKMPSFTVELEKKDFESLADDVQEYFSGKGFVAIKEIPKTLKEQNHIKITYPPNVNITFKKRETEKKRVPENY